MGAGTAPGADDVLPFRGVPLVEQALRLLPESAPLPLDSPVFITVVASNPLGLRSRATSRAFRVDTSPPLLVQAPTVDATRGRVVNGSQVGGAAGVAWPKGSSRFRAKGFLSRWGKHRAHSVDHMMSRWANP